MMEKWLYEKRQANICRRGIMKSSEIAKMTNQLCDEFERKGAKRDLLVQFVGHFKALLKYTERMPDSFMVDNENDHQCLRLNWITGIGSLTIEAMQPHLIAMEADLPNEIGWRMTAALMDAEALIDTAERATDDSEPQNPDA